jgi:hypothetical protein
MNNGYRLVGVIVAFVIKRDKAPNEFWIVERLGFVLE